MNYYMKSIYVKLTAILLSCAFSFQAYVGTEITANDVQRTIYKITKDIADADNLKDSRTSETLRELREVIDLELRPSVLEFRELVLNDQSSIFLSANLSPYTTEYLNVFIMTNRPQLNPGDLVLGFYLPNYKCIYFNGGNAHASSFKYKLYELSSGCYVGYVSIDTPNLELLEKEVENYFISIMSPKDKDFFLKMNKKFDSKEESRYTEILCKYPKIFFLEVSLFGDYLGRKNIGIYDFILGQDDDIRHYKIKE